MAAQGGRTPSAAVAARGASRHGTHGTVSCERDAPRQSPTVVTSSTAPARRTATTAAGARRALRHRPSGTGVAQAGQGGDEDHPRTQLAPALGHHCGCSDQPCVRGPARHPAAELDHASSNLRWFARTVMEVVNAWHTEDRLVRVHRGSREGDPRIQARALSPSATVRPANCGQLSSDSMYIAP